MRRIIFTLFIVCLFLNVVSARSNCVSDGDSEWCCDNPSYVVCDKNQNLCGSTSAWCDSALSHSSISCIPNEDWCCYNADTVVDYSARLCCPSYAPFYNSKTNSCYGHQSDTAFTSNNYYTRLNQCPSSSSKCIGDISYKCEEKDLILQYQAQPKTPNVCGFVGYQIGIPAPVTTTQDNNVSFLDSIFNFFSSTFDFIRNFFSSFFSGTGSFSPSSSPVPASHSSGGHHQ